MQIGGLDQRVGETYGLAVALLSSPLVMYPIGIRVSGTGGRIPSA